jgi:hypothetical protein
MMFTGQAVGPAVAALVDRVVLKPVTGAELVEAIETDPEVREQRRTELSSASSLGSAENWWRRAFVREMSRGAKITLVGDA